MKTPRPASDYRGARRNLARTMANEAGIQFSAFWPRFTKVRKLAKGNRRKGRSS